MPKLPERKNRRNDARTSARPFTSMALSGLAAGLTWRDMRRMKYTHLMQLLWEWDDMNGNAADETVNATMSDARALMSW